MRVYTKQLVTWTNEEGRTQTREERTISMHRGVGISRIVVEEME